jgi:hypothetical protein
MDRANLAEDEDDADRPWRIDGCPGIAYTDRAKPLMGVSLVTLVVRPGGRIGVANSGRLQQIGGHDDCCPAGRDRRQDLHQQREQDDRKKFP